MKIKTIAMAMVPCILCTAVSMKVLATAELAPNGDADRTAELLAAVRTKSSAGGGAVSLAKGIYHFRHTSATPVEVYISNHDQPMPRLVQLPFEGITNVTVNGNGSLLLFHGETCGFLLRGCEGVTLRDFAIDWEDPCILETTIVATPPGGTEVSVDRAKFPCRVEDGGVVLYGDGWRHPLFRESKMFDGVTHEVVPLSGDVLDSGRAKELPNGNLLLAVEYAKAGKGGKPGDRVCLRSRRADKVGRPCPAVTVTRSKDTVMEDVAIHTAFGMGVICQLSENFTWRGTKGADAKTAGMFPRAGTGRYASGNADASHFSNVKGTVREEGCWFEAMMDDAINVHSTCMAITNVLAPDRIVCRYMHMQAIGLDVFGAGDTLRLIRGSTLENGPEMKVVAAKGIGAMEMELTLAEPLPEGYGCGDAVENADYQPEVVFRGNVVARNRARGTLFTTPKPVLVESNRFELVSGSAILFAGDAHYWYESGACRDVTVRGNVFSNCLTSARSHGFCHGVISFCPIVHEMARQRRRYHGNITIEDNVIHTFDAPLLYAYSTENLTWRRNRVTYNDYCPSWGKPPFVVEHCGEILVDGRRVPDAGR